MLSTGSQSIESMVSIWLTFQIEPSSNVTMEPSLVTSWIQCPESHAPEYPREREGLMAECFELDFFATFSAFSTCVICASLSKDLSQRMGYLPEEHVFQFSALSASSTRFNSESVSRDRSQSDLYFPLEQVFKFSDRSADSTFFSSESVKRCLWQRDLYFPERQVRRFSVHSAFFVCSRWDSVSLLWSQSAGYLPDRHVARLSEPANVLVTSPEKMKIENANDSDVDKIDLIKALSDHPWLTSDWLFAPNLTLLIWSGIE